MKNRYKLAVFFIIVFLIFIFTTILFFNKSKIVQVCFNQNCFYVEVAKTPQEQERGLMFRESLEESKGMLFVFNKEENYIFWMKNTLMPLDIIWLNKNGEVVFIKENAMPCSQICESIDPKKDAIYVLELNSGISNQIKLNIGEKMSIFW